MSMDFPVLSPHKRESLNQATQMYYEQLKTSNDAIDYLKGRGIDGEAARSFKLGFVQEPAENHDQMVGMLSIPYITPSGVVAVRFRRLEGEGNKYHQEAGFISPLFNVRDLHRPEPYVAICEGEFDTLVMSALCGVPAVGMAGTGQWSKRGRFYKRLLLDYDKVFVVMDPDKAGRETATAILKVVSNAVNINLPFDVNDTFLTNGRDSILKAMGLWESSEMQRSVSTAA